MIKVHSRSVAFHTIAIALALLGCGGDDGSGTSGAGGTMGVAAFKPAVPPSDTCALLSAADVATILPGAGIGYPVSRAMRDQWYRSCSYSRNDGTTMYLYLGIDGAITENGRWQVNPRGTIVDGDEVGEAASFVPVDETSTLRLTRLIVSDRSYRVEFETDVVPPPTKEALVALAATILPQLE